VFAERRGFTLANTEVHRVLDLPVDEQLLASMIEEAAPHHAGYTIERHVGDLPTDLLPSYCHVYNQLALDAPTGDIDFEAEAITPEVWLEREAQLRAARRLRSSAAHPPVGHHRPPRAPGSPARPGTQGSQPARGPA
jgi:hypothetical protein